VLDEGVLHAYISQGSVSDSDRIIILYYSAFAATLTCSFLSETTISTDGAWVRKEMDFMKLYDMFGDGLSLPLENSLLGNLDTGQPFLAGEVERGKVFLMGGDYGVEGKLIEVNGNEITIYDGMCNIGFG
ncbi:MAG: hypothetical protein ACO3OJ_13495, partial [Paracoccaceae bacterium]